MIWCSAKNYGFLATKDNSGEMLILVYSLLILCNYGGSILGFHHVCVSLLESDHSGVIAWRAV